ncbi:putative plus-3-domain-containing protein [Lyophyllum shimeji]|uniref:Plus-3-domain-containing protein n=1 Tax=Lyophyllum shimeji TaxID=47721 RepID=A0A9P3UM38_LYOSH|nr:putative plus-3-domain-containing protein [Lyophyllum shimeji]
MSDFEDDIGDELLALAGVDKKRKRHQGSSSKASSSKKRRADMSDSDGDEPESEEEEDIDPYPLEGKFIDEADRQRLMQMSEIEREEMIAQRLEEKQRLHDKRMISQMVKEQRAGDLEGVAKAAKRQHTARGATKEKSRKLDELKAKRKAKDEKQRSKGSPKPDRSSSPMDMEISDDESEDGQITKYEQEEEKDRKMFSKPLSADDRPVVLEDLEKCRITRDMLAKYCMAPWFQDYVQDAWVRYLVGQLDGQPVYRICQIINLGADLVKPYRVNDKMANQALELKHGKSVKLFLMDKVSNGPFTPKEFDRLVRQCSEDEVKMPTKRLVERKVAEMTRLVTQPITESDINAMLARKSQLNNLKPTGLTTLERSRLMQARTLAERRHDFAEVAEIDAKLAELGAPTQSERRDETADMLARVNERNRRANMEAVRKAELAEAERKRRERKLAAAGGTGRLTPVDPSARLKTKPRLFDVATPTTRPGTPNLAGTPVAQAKDASRPVSPLPPTAVAVPLNGIRSNIKVALVKCCVACDRYYTPARTMETMEAPALADRPKAFSR